MVEIWTYMVIGCVLGSAEDFLYFKLCKPANFVRRTQFKNWVETKIQKKVEFRLICLVITRKEVRPWSTMFQDAVCGQHRPFEVRFASVIHIRYLWNAEKNILSKKIRF